METNEHIEAANRIRFMRSEYNPYIDFTVSTDGTSDCQQHDLAEIRRLKVFQQPDAEGIPRTTELRLTPGQIVAMAGDYYTQPGWGNQLALPADRLSDEDQRNVIVTQTISQSEKQAFAAAYADLANPSVKMKTIEDIITFDARSSKLTKQLQTWLPILKAPIALLSKILTQGFYAIKVPHYVQKLEQNEAHFAPWSTRAYIVGHQQALDYADIARHLRHSTWHLKPSIAAIVQNARKDNDFATMNDDIGEIRAELAARYEALAYTTSLFTMHFYSDSFAGGHNKRIGRMRLELPEKFGKIGSILVNTMHDFDNLHGVETTNPYQFDSDDSKVYIAPTYENVDEGDGSYDDSRNANNRAALINGMTNSLGDIARVIIDNDTLPDAFDFGGLADLPDVDYDANQWPPLLIRSAQGEMYYRKNLSEIKKLSPDSYRALRSNPENDSDYQRLTLWRAMKLVIRTRLLPILSSRFKLETIDPVADNTMEQKNTQLIFHMLTNPQSGKQPMKAASQKRLSGKIISESPVSLVVRPTVSYYDENDDVPSTLTPPPGI